MSTPPLHPRLKAACERASRRVAEAEAVLRSAAETRELAWVALERSRRLLAEGERSQAGERLEAKSQPWPSAPARKG
jgi:hypothetical protein